MHLSSDVAASQVSSKHALCRLQLTAAICNCMRLASSGLAFQMQQETCSLLDKQSNPEQDLSGCKQETETEAASLEKALGQLGSIFVSAGS